MFLINLKHIEDTCVGFFVHVCVKHLRNNIQNQKDINAKFDFTHTQCVGYMIIYNENDHELQNLSNSKVPQ